jgi:hypothetical protein
VLRSLIALSAAVAAGCATIQGSVVPMEGGQYKAVSIAGNKYTAHKIAAYGYHEKHKEVELTTVFKCKG